MKKQMAASRRAKRCMLERCCRGDVRGPRRPRCGAPEAQLLQTAQPREPLRQGRSAPGAKVVAPAGRRAKRDGGEGRRSGRRKRRCHWGRTRRMMGPRRCAPPPPQRLAICRAQLRRTWCMAQQRAWRACCKGTRITAGTSAGALGGEPSITSQRALPTPASAGSPTPSGAFTFSSPSLVSVSVSVSPP